MTNLEKLLNGIEVEWKPLGEVCEFLNGYAFKSNLFHDTGLPIVRITNIDGKNINLKDVKFFDPADYNNGNPLNYAIVKGDILIAMSGATTGKIGYYNIEETAYLNQRVGKFIPNKTVLNSRYLYHFLLTKSDFLYILAGGGAQPNLSSNSIKEKLFIPIPPIAIQNKIADILDKFATLEAELEAELDCRKRQYDYYRNKLLYSDISNNKGQKSNNIPLIPLGELGTLIRGNGLQKKDLTESGVPAIHYGQIYTYYGIYTSQTISYVSHETARKLRKVNYGDVIITNTSENIEDVGKSVTYLIEKQGVTGGHATIFKPSKKITGKYLAYFTQTYEFTKQKRKYVKGTKVTDLSANDLAKILIPVPSIDEQQRIVSILDKFDKLTTSISEGLPAEIELRRKQYEYYRNKLLSFPNAKITQ